MKILLAVDGSSYTKKMLAYVTTHLEMFSGDNEFTALTVQGALPPRARAAVGKEVVDQYYAEEAAKVLDPVVKFLAMHDIHPRVVGKVGTPGSIIAQVAQEGDFHLVVMGSHGYGALGGLVMGSVATKVLAECTVPVLLVR